MLLPARGCADRSTEFFNTSQYGREYVIGRNCRFLQGPRTSNSAVRRLIDAITAGQEICETILNYRRDGSPFMNLLMIAPLYDNKGQVRYFLGCQIDVSSLIEGGRGMESLSQLLARDRSESRFGGRLEKDPKHALGELSQMLNDDESNIVKTRARRYSEESNRSMPENKPSHRGRRILGMEDSLAERTLWPHASLGPSGRLPGVYQNVGIIFNHGAINSTITDAMTVSSRSPLPIPPHHLHLACLTDTRLTADQILRPHRRAPARPRRCPRRPRPRPKCHGKDLMAHQLRRRSSQRSE